MKLSREQNSGLTEMTRQFDKIEAIAEELGIEVDSLAESCNPNILLSDQEPKTCMYALTANRRQIFRQSLINRNTDHTSIVNLAVIVNEGHQTN